MERTESKISARLTLYGAFVQGIPPLSTQYPQKKRGLKTKPPLISILIHASQTAP